MTPFSISKNRIDDSINKILVTKKGNMDSHFIILRNRH